MGDHCATPSPGASAADADGHPRERHSHDHHGHGRHGHDHGVSADSDPRWLGAALTLIVTFMAGEVVVGLMANSLALLTDAAHMLTDAAAIALALVAIRLSKRPPGGRYTFGYKRAEILSAQANGITLLLLAVWFTYEGIHRLIEPPDVAGPLVFFTALLGIVVNILAAWCISKADRNSLNVEGAFQHILNDLYAFIGTAVAGAAVWLAGFARADAIAALVVAALMVKAGWALVRESGRIFLEAAPADLDPDAIGARLVTVGHVTEVHDLHVWVITSGEPSLSAHVLVEDRADCHAVRAEIGRVLHDEYGLEHTTLQIDHATEADAPPPELHCAEPHGRVHRA
ncbi:cation transporter [Nocardia puris]|uniref:Cobalt-zinc-cadmium efflux system protein n=1 Tax=Nocardia puris TaxID=208602 RepID=A0A366D997_9NOCA|nr:cation diffusion facilitator family transporter [Nocardia puris]MBF6214103.1 cation transporter [Nocardia puris]MBF6368613.1 cation transporter [Nocardia puris]MBF6461515.1 cation transporter [Nocardia puris]RBO86613.1 cobalt-zinc-cadmium efflux system protein [Nocardia puris]